MAVHRCGSDLRPGAQKKSPFAGGLGGGFMNKTDFRAHQETRKLRKAFFKVMAFDFFNQGGAFDVEKFGGIFLDAVCNFHGLGNQGFFKITDGRVKTYSLVRHFHIRKWAAASEGAVLSFCGRSLG